MKSKGGEGASIVGINKFIATIGIPENRTNHQLLNYKQQASKIFLVEKTLGQNLTMTPRITEEHQCRLQKYVLAFSRFNYATTTVLGAKDIPSIKQVIPYHFFPQGKTSKLACKSILFTTRQKILLNSYPIIQLISYTYEPLKIGTTQAHRSHTQELICCHTTIIGNWLYTNIQSYQ